MKKLAIMGAILITILLLAACGGTPAQPNNEPTPQPAEQNTEQPTTEQEPDEEQPVEPASDYLTFGETTTLGNWEITVDSYEVTPKIEVSAYSAYSADEGNQYVVVYLSIKNVGTEADDFLPTFAFGNSVIAKLYYQESYEFTAGNLLGSSEDLHDKRVNPLSSASGYIVFSIAEEAAVSDELTFQLTLGRETLTYELK